MRTTKLSPANDHRAGRYEIRCDHCREVIGRTDDQRRSCAGGRCYECNPYLHTPAGMEVATRKRAADEITLHRADNWHPVAGPFEGIVAARAYAARYGWKVVGPVTIEIRYAYPSSPAAEQMGRSEEGCWYIAPETGSSHEVLAGPFGDQDAAEDYRRSQGWKHGKHSKRPAPFVARTDV